VFDCYRDEAKGNWARGVAVEKVRATIPAGPMLPAKSAAAGFEVVASPVPSGDLTFWSVTENILFAGRFVTVLSVKTFVSCGATVTTCSICHKKVGRRITRESASAGEEALIAIRTQAVTAWLVMLSALSSSTSGSPAFGAR